jgi:predicted ATPase
MLNPDPKKMAAPVRIKDVSPKLEGDGSGLAEVVAIMRDSDDDSFQALQAALSAVVPQIERIRVQRANTHRENVTNRSHTGSSSTWQVARTSPRP